MGPIELLISKEEIRLKILEVARAIDAQYQGEELTIVMVMKGSLCLTADLIRQLQIPTLIEYVSVSSYGDLGVKRGQLKMTGHEKLNLASKNVLVVDDIFDSGNTLFHVVKALEQKQPKTLKTLVLLSKNVDREIVYSPDYVLFDIKNKFVIGYGLDYKELYRGLPDIYFFKDVS